MKTRITSFFSDIWKSAENPQAVHPLLQLSFYAILIGGGLASVLTLGKTSFLPITTLLDAWTVLFIATSVFRGRTRMYVTLYLFVAYCLTRVIPALIISAPLHDFMQAYRWLMYAIAFILAAGRSWGNVRWFAQATWLLLTIAVLKYFITYIVFDGTKRPILFLENNFELTLFAGLVAVSYKNMGKWRLLAVFAIGILTFLSGSRSGAVGFVILVIFAISQIRSARRALNYIALTVIPAAVAVAIWVFVKRTPDLSNIDRVRFARVLFQDTQNWNPVNFIFGTTPITPLTPNSCHQLAYYWELFSSTGDGTCYAVILHAFVLRTIFDAGFFGLLLAFGIPVFAMVRSRVNIGLILTLIGISFANSLSVSGLNSPYVCLPIIFALLISHDYASSLRQSGSSQSRV